MTTTDIELATPAPGVDLIPDGWWRTTVVPWADAQTTHHDLAEASSQLAGLIAKHRVIREDTLELTKAQRYLELRWGELLGEGVPGPSETARASEPLLTKDDRHRFRQLAAARDQILELLEDATDPDNLTRKALLRAARHDNEPVASPAELHDLLHNLADESSEPDSTERFQERRVEWTAPQTKLRVRAEDRLGLAKRSLENATADGLSRYAILELVNDARIRAQEAAAALGELALTLER